MILKAPIEAGPNRNCKSICRPERVDQYVVHGAHYKAPYSDCAVNGCGGPFQPIQIDYLRVNHYWLRSEEYFRKYKVPRRERYENRKISEEEILALIQGFNVEVDTSIHKYLPQLKEAMKH
jgi:hypothetical protein